jgi:hypothetical protein
VAVSPSEGPHIKSLGGCGEYSRSSVAVGQLGARSSGYSRRGYIA